jgi:uncharacterized protein YlxW (UPF0749 family)
MLGLFGINKFTMFLIAFVFISSVYYIWKKNIEHAALIEFNNAQMQQTLKDQEKYIQDQKRLADQTIEAVNQIQANNAKLQTKIGNLNNIINTSQNQSSSTILKQTFEKLTEIQQEENKK